MKKRILSAFVAFAMILSMVPTAFAASGPESTLAGTGSLKDWRANQAVGKGATYYDYVYYGNGQKWRVLDTEANSGSGTGVMLLLETPMNYGQAWNSYRINSDRSGSDTTLGYNASDIRAYLTGQGSYNVIQTARSISDEEAAYTIQNCYYFREDLSQNPSVLAVGPQPGKIYYEYDGAPTYKQETEILAASNFADGKYYTKSGEKYTLADSYSEGTTYYYDASSYKLAELPGGKFETGKEYFIFHPVTGADLTTARSDKLLGTRYYIGYSIGVRSKEDMVSGLFASDRNYAKDTGISAAEQAAVLSATKTGPDASHKYAAGNYDYYGGSLCGDTYFLLSAKEANSYEYGMHLQANRKARYNWWLRDSNNYRNPGFVGLSGVFNIYYATLNDLAVRPAFYLNPASVIFTSAAVGGKSSTVAGSFSKLADSATQEYKLTLKDGSMSVTPGAVTESGGVYTVAYSDASTSGSNVYLSAIVTDGSGEKIYGYAKLKNIATDGDKSGSASFTLPAGLENQNCVVKLFLEKDNGSKQTDYASEPIVILTLEPECTHEWSDWKLDQSCTEDGTQSHTCALCGKTENEPVSASTHTLVKVEKISAECEKGNGGVEEHWECSQCGALFKADGTTPTTYGDLLINERHVTARVYHAVDEAKHYWNTECKACGYIVVNRSSVINHEAHIGFVCTEGGTCKDCGYVVPAGTHAYLINNLSTFKGYVPGKEPTCEENGFGYYGCVRCGELREVEVNKLGHLMGGTVVVLEPTFDAEGQAFHYCTRCMAGTIEPIPQLERTPAEIKIEGPDTLEMTGSPVSASTTEDDTFTYTHCNANTHAATGLAPTYVVKWYQIDDLGKATEIASAPSNPGKYKLEVSSGIVTKADNSVSYKAAVGEKYFEITAPEGDNLITKFTVPGQKGDTLIDHDNGTVEITMPFGTDPNTLKNLVPTIEVSENATVAPASGVAQNFSGPVNYTVTSKLDIPKAYTVTVKIAPQPYANVSFETNGGSACPTIHIKSDSNSEYGVLPTTEKSGFHFDGWYSDPDFKDGTEITSTSKVISENDHVLYAKWTQKLTLLNKDPYAIQTRAYKDGAPVDPYEPKMQVNGSDPAVYVSDGYSDVEYKVSGADDSTYTKTVPSAVGTYDVRFTRPEDDTYLAVTYITGIGQMKITADPCYVIYTDGVDGEEIFADQKHENLDPGTATPAFDTTGITLDSKGNPARDKYVFTGWLPEVSAVVNGNTIYKAQWAVDNNENLIPDENENLFNVIYVANGAESGTVPVDAVDYAKNQEATVLGNTGSLARSGYTFNGWNTAADGTGTDYAAGDKLTVSETTLLYAKWKKSDVTITVSAPNVVYDGTAKTPELTVKVGSTTLTADQYVAVYKDNVNVGTATVEVYGIKEYAGFSQTANFQITKGTQALAFSKPGAQSMTYGDSFANPAALTTAFGGAITYKSSDESIAAVDANGNITAKKAGTVTITATAAGSDNFDTKSVTYELTVKKATPVLTFENSTVNVKFGDAVENALTTEPTGLTVTYESSDESVATVGADGKVTILKDGSATITAKFAGNDCYAATTASYTLKVAADQIHYTASDYVGDYDGSAHGAVITVTVPATATVTYTDSGNNSYTDAGTHSVNYTITATGYETVTGTAKVVINKAALTEAADIAAVVYDGNAKTPAVSGVKAGTSALSTDDYDVTYISNVNVGEATVLITAKAGSNYTGTLVKTFKINAKTLTDEMVAAITNQPYTGSPAEPLVIVTDGGTTLVEGKDFKVTYSNNTNVGTATAKVEGLGNYTGTVNKAFKITNDNKFTVIVDNTMLVYDGTEKKPAVIVIDKDNNVLTEGTDYTLSYKDNIAAGTGQVTVTGIKNYVGCDPVSKTFPIQKADRTAAFEEAVVNKNFGDEKFNNPLTVTPADGAKVTYSSSDPAVATVDPDTGDVTIVGTGSCVITATIEATDNYNGVTTDFTLKAGRKDISKPNSNITVAPIPDQTYTGEEIKPTVTVKDGDKTLTEGVDYIVNYKDNTNVGTATATITGIGDYEGELETNFNIVGKTTGLTVNNIPNQTYTGKQIKPAVTVKDGSKTLTEGVDYVVTYGDNVGPGEGTAKIEFIGNYAGADPIEKKFAIIKTTNTLTFDAKEGTNAPAPLTVEKGTKITLSAYTATAPAGKTFIGWYDANGNKLTEVTLNEDMTVYAKYANQSSGGGTVIKDKNPPQASLDKGNHTAYITGYADGTVRPLNNITRAEIAAIFFRLLDDETRQANMTFTNEYTDVADTYWCNVAISTLSKMGIITGFSDGTFRPTEKITRAQFVTIAVRFFDVAVTPTTDAFNDIAGHWARNYINQAYAIDLTHGYADGTFRPNNLITRAEAITIVNRSVDREPTIESLLPKKMTTWTDNMDPNAWYYVAIQEAGNSHLYEADKENNEMWTKVREPEDWAALQAEWIRQAQEKTAQ